MIERYSLPEMKSIWEEEFKFQTMLSIELLALEALAKKRRGPAAQFKDKDTISVQRIFAGRKLRVEFSNPRRLCFGQYKIGKAVLNAQDLVINDPQKLDISRAIINSLPKDRIIPLKIILG